MKMIKTLFIYLQAILIGLLVSACGKQDTRSNQSVNIKLSYMYWGSNIEKKAQSDMVEKFNKTHPDIQVTPLHVPGSDYDAKMATLVASNNPPDVAYLEDQLYDFAKFGKLLDLNTMLKKDNNLKSDEIIDKCKYYLDDKIVGLSNALETVQLFYNKDLFKKAGIDLPPSRAEDAWTWEEFVKVAQKLTIDKNGKHADEPGFDPQNIKQYGVAFGTNYYQYMPVVWSNGGDISTPDGKDTLIDKPEFIEAIQKLTDLVYKYHVSPSLSQRKSMPGISVILLTGQVAMAVDGQWSMLDLVNTKVSFGIGVLPKLKKPVTLAIGSPIVIFSETKHPDASWEFAKYHFEVKNAPDLYTNGLWMPILKKYYTDPECLKEWIDNPAHPKEYKTAVVDYMLKYSKPSPCFNLKNWPKISEELISGMDNIWLGNVKPEAGLPELAKKIRPLFEGLYSNAIPEVSL